MNTDMLSRIENAMEAKGLTKAEVSRLAGLAPTFLRDLFPDSKTGEVRKKSVSYDNLLAIAEVLDTTPEWLAQGRGAGTEGDGAEIIGIIPRLKKDDRAKVAEYARMLAAKNRSRK